MEKVEDQYLAVDSSSSSSSSSSDEEVVIKKKGGKDSGGPAGLCFMAHGHKRRSRKGSRSPRAFCGMALDKEKEGHKGCGTNDDSDSDVSVTEEEILEILEDNRKELKRYARVTRKLSEAFDKVSAELAIANGKLEAMSASLPEPVEPEECQSCLVVMADVVELRHNYAKRVDERDEALANLESTKKALLAAQAILPTLCETCPRLSRELELLREQCETRVGSLEAMGAELEELRARPALLEACKVCPTLREQLVQARSDLEK